MATRVALLLRGGPASRAIARLTTTGSRRRPSPILNTVPREIPSILTLHSFPSQSCRWISSLESDDEKTSTPPDEDVTPSSVADSQVPPQPNIPPRPWLDVKVPLDVRVKTFLEAPVGSFDPHVLAFDGPELAKSCCRFQSFFGMQMAHDILDRTLRERWHVNTELKGQKRPLPIPVLVFEELMYGWACMASKEKSAKVRMRDLLDLFLAEVLKDDENAANGSVLLDEESKVLPEVQIYNTFLFGLRNAARLDFRAAFQADNLLEDMYKKHQQFGWHVKPNTKSFTHVITAYANGKHTNAGPKAEEVLRKMQRAQQEGLQAYLEQYGVPYVEGNPSANRRRIVGPDEYIYTAVITAYSNSYSPRAAEKARDLMVEVVNKKDGSVTLDGVLFAAAMNAFARVAENRKISNAARQAAALQAEEILWVMVDKLKLQEEDDAVNGDQRNIRKSKPTKVIVSFNSCMNAYARSGSPEAVYRAEALLQKLLSGYIDGKSEIQPDTISFNSVLHGWSQATNTVPDAAKKAEELLNLQLDLTSSGALDACAKPDSQSYGIVINAYARTEGTVKVHHAHRLLKELLSAIADGRARVGKNIAVPFTTVLNACANSTAPVVEPAVDGFTSEPADDVYTIAMQTYRELKDDVYELRCVADHYFFAAMLKVVERHTDSNSVERRQMVGAVFEDACAAGQVSRLVVKALQQACPDKEMLAGFLRNTDLADEIKTVDQLPRSWTRRVPKQFRAMIRPGKKFVPRTR